MWFPRRLVIGLSAARRLIREVRRQPAFDPLDRLAFAPCVGGDLILADPADGEIPILRTCVVQSADAGGGGHRAMLSKVDADAAGIQQIEQLEVLAVVRARGIAERGPDPAVL